MAKRYSYKMNLGWLDFCIRVSNVPNSAAFYEGLGFRKVEGDPSDGWVVLSMADSRIGLFESKFMSTPFSLNFRGGHVNEIVSSLQEQGYGFEGQPKVRPDGSGSAHLHDPDGNLIFFDSAPNEVKPE